MTMFLINDGGDDEFTPRTACSELEPSECDRVESLSQAPVFQANTRTQLRGIGVESLSLFERYQFPLKSVQGHLGRRFPRSRFRMTKKDEFSVFLSH